MALKLTDDGRVLNEDGNEITYLTDFQLDELIKQKYPDLPTSRDWTRHQTSWSGMSTNMDWFSNIYKSPEYDNCEVTDRVYTMGGTRLLTLYCNKFNFFSAAQDLCISYGALMKWFQRWRTQILKQGITSTDMVGVLDDLHRDS